MSAQTIETIAAEIGDGWQDFASQRRRLKQLERALPTDGPVDFGRLAQQAATDPEMDIAAAVEAAIEHDRHREVMDRTMAVITGAQRELTQAERDWKLSHEPQISAAIQEQRLALQERARLLVPGLSRIRTAADLSTVPQAASAFATAAVLLKDFDELRTAHISILRLQPLDTVRWIGADWVGNFDTAWPEFFAIAGVDVVDADGHFLLRNYASTAPWDTDEVAERIRVIAKVQVWTPTRFEFDSEQGRLSQAQIVAEKAFAEQYRIDHPRGQRTAASGTQAWPVGRLA